MTETSIEPRLATGSERGSTPREAARNLYRRRLANLLRPEAEAQTIERLEPLVGGLGAEAVDQWVQGSIEAARAAKPADLGAYLWSRLSRSHPRPVDAPTSEAAQKLVKKELARHVAADVRPRLERRVDVLFERFGEAHTARWLAQIGRRAEDASMKNRGGFVFQRVVNEDPPVVLDTAAEEAAPAPTHGELLAKSTKEYREQVRDGVLGDLAQRIMDLAGAPPSPGRNTHKPLSREWSEAWMAWKARRCAWERDHGQAAQRRAEELYDRAARELEDEGTPVLPVLVGERAHALLGGS